MSVTIDGKDLSREEDFRDYEERNIDGGWPYADGAAGPAGNGAYGEGDGNFDEAANAGFRTKTVDADGGEPDLVSPVLPETDHRENSDQLEADITEHIESIDGVVIDGIDVHVDGHVVTLDGVVDAPTERHQIEQVVLATRGVSEVRNRIRTAGVDSHIPDAD
ncbi:BON domain-containing protein [Rhizobium sp. RU36D]|uniref:BON domain-containing protein n=1 Tax=Rhizobium sp. RU36D TaxID=1907415 RepID=UPI0009D8568D|nr:BON domain-containing protein [Rhizobium sp. RU36D]SMC82896.1 BON domain-containing protein [Rhizobium sp. RU36D]